MGVLLPACSLGECVGSQTTTAPMPEGGMEEEGEGEGEIPSTVRKDRNYILKVPCNY